MISYSQQINPDVLFRQKTRNRKYKALRREFLNSPEREKQFSEMIRKRVNYLKNKNGNDIELKVKLVLAKKRDTPIKLAQRLGELDSWICLIQNFSLLDMYMHTF